MGSQTQVLEVEERLLELKALSSKSRADQLRAQECVRLLDEALSTPAKVTPAYADVVRRFQLQCCRLRIAPPSCTLADTIHLENGPSVAYSGTSERHLGLLGPNHVAIKVVRIAPERKLEGPSEEVRYKAILWRCLKHPNIVSFLGLSPNFPLGIVTPWMVNGNVKDYLVKRPTANRLKLIHEALLGLQFMHNLGIVHSNLKATNVLVNDAHQACLTDHGMASILQHSAAVNGSEPLRNIIPWMAPELFQGEAGSPLHRYTAGSDMYSMAMVIWEIFSGQVPFDDLQTIPIFQLMVLIVGGDCPPEPLDKEALGFPDLLWKLVVCCWSAEPADRPSCSAMLSVVSACRNPNVSTAGPGVISESEAFGDIPIILVQQNCPPSYSTTTPTPACSRLSNVSEKTALAAEDSDLLKDKLDLSAPSNEDSRQIVRTGPVNIEASGRFRSGLRTRWLILDKSNLLVYKTQNAKIPIIDIPLTEIIKVEREADKPRCLGVATKSRITYFYFTMDKELYDWQYDILERPGALSAISHPWNFVHLTHIHYDRVNQEYRGVPTMWQKLLDDPAREGVTEKQSVRWTDVHPQSSYSAPLKAPSRWGIVVRLLALLGRRPDS